MISNDKSSRNAKQERDTFNKCLLNRWDAIKLKKMKLKLEKNAEKKVAVQKQDDIIFCDLFHSEICIDLLLLVDHNKVCTMY